MSDRIAELERRVSLLERALSPADHVDRTAATDAAPTHGDVARLAEEYLAAYPVKTEQDFATQCFISVWNKCRDKQAFVDAVWSGLQRWMDSSKWRDKEGELDLKFIPGPARFLGFDRGMSLGVTGRMYMDHPPPMAARRVSVLAVDPAEIERQRREVTPEVARQTNERLLAKYREELAGADAEYRAWIYREFPELRKEATA